MHLHKTSGNTGGKPAPEISAQKPPPNAARMQTVTKVTVTKVTAQAGNLLQGAMRSVSSIISSAGLPADKLSADIVSFARFFSLPLKPELLKNIRQQAFTMTPNSASPEPASVAEDGASKSALSLASAAAESKGTELTTGGLQAYARAIDPEWRQRQDSGQHDRRRNKNDGEKEDAPSQKTPAITAGSLERTALEWEEKNPLFTVLNRLPEKDGKRWVVFPFDFYGNGREFKVSLRILIETGKTVNRAGCMALDISAYTARSGKTERQLFVLEPANRLLVYLQSEISPKEQSALAHDLSALLEVSHDRIFIKTWTKPFPFEADTGNDLLRSIDEAV
ncbi:MAG: hypothetical protein LBV17_10515 [Treponema sp.]|jgi:hypothetical protein|nr:hypothetical protein [Treponema sp.]